MNRERAVRIARNTTGYVLMRVAIALAIIAEQAMTPEFRKGVKKTERERTRRKYKRQRESQHD